MDGMKLQWLVFFPGRPSSNDWKRMDAASRIVRAALSHESPCHLIFDDKTAVSFEAGFLGAWNGKEDHFVTLLQSMLKGEAFAGALHRPRTTTLRDCLLAFRPILGDVDAVLDFSEHGTMAFGSFPKTTATKSALCVIGGVKDIFQREHELLSEMCKELQKPQLSISLGCKPELTSKCIKAGSFTPRYCVMHRFAMPRPWQHNAESTCLKHP